MGDTVQGQSLWLQKRTFSDNYGNVDVVNPLLVVPVEGVRTKKNDGHDASGGACNCSEMRDNRSSRLSKKSSDITAMTRSHATQNHINLRSSSSSNRNRQPYQKATTISPPRSEKDLDNTTKPDPSYLKVVEDSMNVHGSRRFKREGNSVDEAMGGKEPAVKGCGIMTTTTFTKLVTLIMMLYYGGNLWLTYFDPATGKICPFSSKNVCATSVGSKVLLTISKVAAGGLFSCMTWCMLSKFYATRYFLHNSWLALIVNFEPAHDLHTYYGKAALLCSVLHGGAHIARAAYDNKFHWIFQSQTNRSGLVALTFLLLIAVPMATNTLKKKMKFEVRKALHMLFIPFLVALCFHSKALKNFCSVLLVWYLVDRLYFTTKMTFSIDHPTYKAIGRGTFVVFDLPEGYKFKVGAYVQVNCPAISASEWHPFSLVPVPGSQLRAGFHVEAVGDWTRELFRLSLEEPRMPLWITAAQPSVLEETVYFDNVILVCTGAGITPAVSLVDMFAKKKNVHLVWMSREASMVAMFEKQLRRVKSTVHLTGKPSEKTKARMVDLLAPSREEVVNTFARVSCRENSRSSSYSDLTALEAGKLSFSPVEFRGELKGEGGAECVPTHGEADSNIEGSDIKRSVLSGVPAPNQGSAQANLDPSKSPKNIPNGGSLRDLAKTQKKRKREEHPVSLNFGRPNIERFITETVAKPATKAEWTADSDGNLSPKRGEANSSTFRKSLTQEVLLRLNTNQRISKEELMSADLSVVGAKTCKGSSVSSTKGSDTFDEKGAQDGNNPIDLTTWLVLFCGANSQVEKAVASVCDELNITWRKEYFSSW